MFKHILAPYRELAKTALEVKNAGRPAVKLTKSWERPDHWEETAKIAAFTSKLLWYVVAAIPLWFGYGVYADRSLFFFWNSFWFFGVGILMALRFALIARQCRTGDLDKSRIQNAFRDGWWFPEA